MNVIASVFWNSEQRRPRTLWRLVAQIVLLVGIMVLLQIAIGTFILGAVVARGGLTAEQLSDPQALQELMMQDPRLVLSLQLSLTVAIVGSVWVSGRFLDRRPFADFGLHVNRDWWIDLGFGLIQGAGLMMVVFLIELAAGWIKITDTFATRQPNGRFLPAILAPLFTFLAVGFHEELFSRGYQLRNLAEGFNTGPLGPKGGIIIATTISSMFFGFLHATNPNATVTSTIHLMIAGFHLAAGYLLTGELAIPIGLHISWNFFQGNVFGFPVSGTDFRSATIIQIEQGGPDLMTGGAFGPEAGLLGLVAMVIGVALTVLWVRWRYGRAELRSSLARPSESAMSQLQSPIRRS